MADNDDRQAFSYVVGREERLADGDAKKTHFPQVVTGISSGPAVDSLQDRRVPPGHILSPVSTRKVEPWTPPRSRVV
ncbi:MAG: hypothetical protein ABSG48_05400 [Geobacteraceae bacterium]